MPRVQFQARLRFKSKMCLTQTEHDAEERAKKSRTEQRTPYDPSNHKLFTSCRLALGHRRNTVWLWPQNDISLNPTGHDALCRQSAVCSARCSNSATFAFSMPLLMKFQQPIVSRPIHHWVTWKRAVGYIKKTRIYSRDTFSVLWPLHLRCELSLATTRNEFHRRWKPSFIFI